MAEQAIGPPVADEAVVVGETPCGKPMQCLPGAAVVERSRRPVTLNARARLVTHPARLGIESRGRSVTAQTPERGVALGRMGAMAIGANRRGVAAGARAPLRPGIIFVPGQISVRAQPDLVVVERLEGSPPLPAGRGNRWWSDSHRNWGRLTRDADPRGSPRSVCP